MVVVIGGGLGGGGGGGWGSGVVCGGHGCVVVVGVGVVVCLGKLSKVEKRTKKFNGIYIF